MDATVFYRFEQGFSMVPVYFWLPALGCLGMGFMFLNVSAVAEQFRLLFDLNYAGLGVFLSAPFWAHTLVQIPAGLIVDRLGTLRALVLSCVLCAAACFVPLLAPHSLWLAVVMRLIVGLATGLLFLAVVSAVKLLCPPVYMSRAQGLQGAAFSLGTMVPFVLLPWFGGFGWAAAYALGGLLPVVLLVLLVVTPLAPLRQESAAASLSLKELLAVLGRVAHNRRLWYIGCCHGFSFGTITALGNWLTVMLADSSKASGQVVAGSGGGAVAAWSLATSMVLLAGTFARVAGGELGRTMPKPRLLALLVAGIGLFYLLVALACSSWVSNVWMLLGFALPLAMCCGGTYATVFTLTIEVAGARQTATAIGFMSMLANCVNVALILLMGVVRQYAGGFAPAMCLVGLSVWALILWGRKIDWRSRQK